MVVSRRDESISVQFGDWQGVIVDPDDSTHPFHGQIIQLLEHSFPKLITLMRTIRLGQAEFYFSTGLVLMDVRLELNRYAGPGMITDVFGKLVDTPETIKIEVLDQRAMDFITKGTGSYEGDLLLKPSRSRPYELPDGSYVPFYVAVRR